MSCPVMVVDDDPAIRSMVGKLLRSWGVEAIELGGGEECLSRLESGFKGLILMDVVMPKLDGWGTIRQMLSRNMMNGRLICMLTGICEPESEGEGLEEYVMDYLTKPVEIDALREVVKRATECLSH